MHMKLKKSVSLSQFGHLTHTPSLFCSMKINARSVAECNTKLQLLTYTLAQRERACNSD